MSNSKKLPSAFLDSNVIANWIIVSSALKIKEPIEEKAKKNLLNELSTPIKKSFQLLEKIKNVKLSANIFFTSNIALSEVFSVIGDEWRAKTLYKKGIPMRYWGNMIN
ncbi:MAG: hypothetical protein QCI00_06715, partial [Candidatus Thermoplasmatota archaeon]|nr:hypothetical protein [Candidatus Thermoplasmatota archaeon]